MPLRRFIRRIALSIPAIQHLVTQRNELAARVQDLSDHLLHTQHELSETQKALLASQYRLVESGATLPENADDQWLLGRDVDSLRTDGLCYRLSLFGLSESDLIAPRALPPSHLINDNFRSHFKHVLEQTFFHDWPSEHLAGPAYESNLWDHVEGRYSLFSGSIVPWLKSAAPNLDEMTVLEIGSGTGASSLAFAQDVKQLICFEIDGQANIAARKRLEWFGVTNVEIVEGFFSADSEFVKQGRRAQLIILCAVLEHMTTDEVVSALKLAWQCLDPGGLLLVADTPNRFSPVDGHTSLLPLFSTLPAELKATYASRSPRADFRDAVEQSTPEDLPLLLTRWGSGISFHEFEVALGPDIHEWVVLDGYEEPIRAISNLTLGDATTRFIFDRFGVKAHRAFTRGNLYFVLKKPADTQINAL